MGTTIDGLASGLNTTAIIDSLMAVEALPQQQLKSKLAADQTMISALQQFSTKLAASNKLATASSAAGALNLFTAKSTDPAVTATASTTASQGSLDFNVTQLAQSKVGVSAAMATWSTDANGPIHLTIIDATGRVFEIAPDTDSLDDVVKAVNAAGTGANAIKLPAGNGSYRIQFSGSSSGAAGDFQVFKGTSDEVTAGTAQDLFAEPGAAVVKTAQDAKLTLYGGTAAETVISSATNTFKDLLPGVSVTATAVSATPVTVTITSDNAAVSKKASDLVASVNDLLSFVSLNSAVTSTTNAAGGSSAKGGIFTGNSSVRAISEQIFNAVSAPVNGKSPSEYGIVISREGNFTFDQDKMTAALAADPSGTQSALSQIATRVAAATKSATDPYDGSVTQLIKGRQSQVSNLTDQIATWDVRLASRRSTLQSVYTNMESLLGGLNAQSSWLTSQLAGLSSNSSQGA